jgi:hypothetical protein
MLTEEQLHTIRVRFAELRGRYRLLGADEAMELRFP